MFAFNLALVVFLCVTNVGNCDKAPANYNDERFYVTRVILADVDISDGTVAPVWFRLGGSDNTFTEWFSSSELTIPGTGYDLSRYLDDIGIIPQTLTIVKFDDNIVKIDQVIVDFNNYTFPSPRSLGVSSDDISSLGTSLKYCPCDIVTVNFFTQSHENEYYWNDCPYKQLKPSIPQNSYNGTIWRSILNSNVSTNASVNASVGAPVYVSYSDYLASLRVNKSVNVTTKAMNAPRGSPLRLYNAHAITKGIESNGVTGITRGVTYDIEDREDISVPTSLPAPAASTVLATDKPARLVEQADSLPPPMASTYFKNGLIQ